MNQSQSDRPSLADTGWQQGSFLPAEASVNPTMWVHHREQLDAKAAKAARDQDDPFPFVRSMKSGSRFVVITQTCDVIKAADLLPQIEVARVFATFNPVVMSQARDAGSARYFLLTEADEGGWVLDYGWRTFLDKGFLVACEPDNSIVAAFDRSDEARLSGWLGRRNGRPALSDEDVAVICDPIRRRFERLFDEEPASAARYAAEFIEFRFRREEDGTVTIFLLSAKDSPDELLALEVMDLLKEAIPTLVVRLASDKISYATFTKADELSTEQIDLYWASYEEGDRIGPVPTP